MENIREILKKYFKLFNDYHKDGNGLGDEIFTAETDLEELANKIVEHFGIGAEEKENYLMRLRSTVNLEGMKLDYFSNTIIEWFSKKEEYCFFQTFEIIEIEFNDKDGFLFFIQYITCEFDYEAEKTKKITNKDVLQLDYIQAEKLFRNIDYPGYLIFDSILRKLKKRTNDYSFEIKIEKEFGEVLYNNKIIIKTIHEKRKQNDFYRVVDIYLNPEKDENSSPFDEFDNLHSREVIHDKLKECNKILEDSYTMFLRLQELGIEFTRAREKSGLTDDMLYRIAYYTYKTNHLSNDYGFGDLKEYIKNNADFLINEDEIIVILKGFNYAWYDVSVAKFEWHDYYESILRYLTWTKKLLPSATITEVLNLIFEYMRDNRIRVD